MKTIETVGKTIEQALKSGIAELGCKLDDVDVKIIEHPGIFRKARVKMTYHGDDETVEKKTAASVMRNLEQRAARVAVSGGREDRNKQNRPDSRDNRDNRKNDRTDKNDKNDRPRPEREQDRRRQEQSAKDQRQPRPEQPQEKAGVRTQPQSAPTAPERREDREKKPQQSKPEFRRDFRAELDAATANGSENHRPEKKDERRREIRETVSPEALAAAKERVTEYIRELTSLMGMPSEVDAEIKEDCLDAVLMRGDEELVGSRGETLDAIEHLATLAANGGDNRSVRVNLDCGGYRARITDALASSALEAADRAVATGKRVELPAMTSSGRRVVHAALGEREDVITRSEGREPNRYIVILPKRAGGDNGNRRPNGGNGGYNKKKNWSNRGRRNPNGDNGAK